MMQPDTARVSGNDEGLGRVQEMMTPVRDCLEVAARDLVQRLTKAGESVRKIDAEDVAELMRRSPFTALVLAAGAGFLAGLLLWPRER